MISTTKVTTFTKSLLALNLLRDLRVLRGFTIFFVVLTMAASARAQDLPPELTQPVNDFANVQTVR
jgi:hypothetical protein